MQILEVNKLISNVFDMSIFNNTEDACAQEQLIDLYVIKKHKNHKDRVWKCALQIALPKEYIWIQ